MKRTNFMKLHVPWPLSRIVASFILLGSLLGLLVAPGATPAHAAPIVYTAPLSGAAESPPNNSPGTGSTRVTLDVAAHTLRIQVSFGDLLGPTTAAHIHACTATPGVGTAGVATQVPTFNDFPLGVTTGTYDRTFNTLDAATYNPSFVTANGGTPATAEARLAECLGAGRAYMNVHSSSFPGGEIRGFLLLSRGQVPDKPPIPVQFGLAGEAIDPPRAAGGSTRDRVDPPVIIIRSGESINYVNAGAPHQVAIYDKNLAKNGTTPPTTFADIDTAAGTGTFLDDPVGRLTLGGPGVSVSTAFINTTGAVEQYLVICAFRPHFVDYGMAQIVLVTPDDGSRTGPQDGPRNDGPRNDGPRGDGARIGRGAR
jgi:hypothetical protein